MTAPIAPTLAIAVVDTDAHFVIAGDIINGDTVYLRYGTDPTLATNSEVSVVVFDSAIIDFGVGLSSLAANTTYYFEVLTERSAELSNPSLIVSLTTGLGIAAATGAYSLSGNAAGLSRTTASAVKVHFRHRKT